MRSDNLVVKNVTVTNTGPGKPKVKPRVRLGRETKKTESNYDFHAESIHIKNMVEGKGGYTQTEVLEAIEKFIVEVDKYIEAHK